MTTAAPVKVLEKAQEKKSKNNYLYIYEMLESDDLKDKETYWADQ